MPDAWRRSVPPAVGLDEKTGNALTSGLDQAVEAGRVRQPSAISLKTESVACNVSGALSKTIVPEYGEVSRRAVVAPMEDASAMMGKRMFEPDHAILNTEDLFSFFSQHVHATPARAFLSFSTVDRAAAEMLRGMLIRQNIPLELLDHSRVDVYDKTWKFCCDAKIRRSNFFICLIGRTTYTSSAVTWEIAKALEYEKPIVPVTIYGHASEIPSILQNHAYTLCGNPGSRQVVRI